MNPVPVIISGIPGKTALSLARHFATDPRVRLLPQALTGPEISAPTHIAGDRTFALVLPEQHAARLAASKMDHPDLVVVDFTHPSAVNRNAELFCQLELPFVMGTTGGDRRRLRQTVTSSATAAVIAPNMAKPIVAFQAMLEYAAQHFPGVFQQYRLSVKESHQQGKADTSGTAKAVLACFQKMGVDCSSDDIIQERDPQVQAHVWGIPQEHLAGHGWHTYTLLSPDRTVRLEFTHNINGREVYAQGTLDAVLFLARQVRKGAAGRVYSMTDVLQAAAPQA